MAAYRRTRPPMPPPVPVGAVLKKQIRAVALAASLLLVPSAGAAQDSSESGIPDPAEIPIALMVDMSSGQTLYAREADRRFIPASITKVMTTFLAFELMDEGKLFPRQVFTVSDTAFDKWNRVGSTMFLSEDARVTVDQLLHGITTVSANDGSVVLAEGAAGSVDAWVRMMNAKAREIGMQDSHFGTPNGWPDEGRTFVSARDLAILAEAMIARHPAKFQHYVGQPGYEYNGIAQVNHDPISGKVHGADGIKTGFTNEAGYGFLGTAKRDGRRLIMVVAGADRGAIRNRASRRFMEWGFEAFDRRALFPEGAVIGTAQVQDGDAASVDLVAKAPIAISLPADIDPEIAMTLEYKGPLRAPIRRDEVVAHLSIQIEDMPPVSVPLYPAAEIERAGILARIVNGFRGIFT